MMRGIHCLSTALANIATARPHVLAPKLLCRARVDDVSLVIP